MARTKSSACSAMRISKTACRKKQDDRLQPGDGRFLYSWYNYTICNREIFRRYSGAAGGGGFTPHGLYPQQRASGSAVPAACRRRRDWLPMGRPGIAAARRRGQEGKDNQGFLSPLNSPNFPLSRSAKHSRLNGGYGGSVPCVVSLMGRCAALNLLSATCTGSASIKNEALEHQTHLWAPRF